MRVIKDMAIVEPLVDVVEPKQVRLCLCVGRRGLYLSLGLFIGVCVSLVAESRSIVQQPCFYI